MPIISIIGIKPGMTTEVFAKWKIQRKRLAPVTYNKDVAEKEAKCFSIIWNERSLDLEATDNNQRNSWVKALEIVWKEKRDNVAGCRQQ